MNVLVAWLTSYLVASVTPNVTVTEVSPTSVLPSPKLSIVNPFGKVVPSFNWTFCSWPLYTNSVVNSILLVSIVTIPIVNSNALTSSNFASNLLCKSVIALAAFTNSSNSSQFE